MRIQTDLSLYWRLLRQARPYWPHIFGIFVISLLATPIALLAPVPLALAVDSVIGAHPLPGFLDAIIPDFAQDSEVGLLLAISLLLVLVEVLRQVRGIADSVARTYTGEMLVLGFRARLFRHVQRLSLSYHDVQGTADSTYRIQYDATAIQRVAVDGVIPFLGSAVTLTAMLYVIARIDLLLAGVALVVTPLLFLLTWFYRRRLRIRHREVKKLESSALSIVQEVLGSLRVVKAFGQEDREHDRFVGRSGEGTRARVRVALIDGAFALLIGVVTALGAGIVLFVGVRRVDAGAMTLGDLLLVMSYLTQLYSPLSTMSKKMTSLQSAFASAERVFGLLDQVSEVPEKRHARRIARASGNVEFRDVHFSYDGKQPVLRGVSFQVKTGQGVGIAGTTGAGKTTLMNLLMRFYDPSSGSILLDGVDLRDYDVGDLRDQFALVLQEPVLFSTSIAENISYARPDADEGQIVAAAKAAGAHDFITALPDGYDTPVGERGMRLSGGERQRISLARAFLKDAPILILDEPTSAVDVYTEATIMTAMKRLMKNRTTFMIAHRLGTLENCDVRLEVEGGQLARQLVGTSGDQLSTPLVVASPARSDE